MFRILIKIYQNINISKNFKMKNIYIYIKIKKKKLFLYINNTRSNF